MAGKRSGANPELLKRRVQELEARLAAQKDEALALLGANMALDRRVEDLEEENWRLAHGGALGEEPAAAPLDPGVPGLEIARALSGVGRPTVTGCLRIVSALLPERFEVLPEAWRSAAAMDPLFRNTPELLRLLATLATGYWEAAADGRDPNGVFSPGQYAAHESETTAGNAALRQARVFSCHARGRRIPMEKHLRIGVASDRAHTLRVYFEWLADEKKVVVGHCGEHLPLLGRGA